MLSQSHIKLTIASSVLSLLSKELVYHLGQPFLKRETVHIIPPDCLYFRQLCPLTCHRLTHSLKLVITLLIFSLIKEYSEHYLQTDIPILAAKYRE